MTNQEHITRSVKLARDDWFKEHVMTKDGPDVIVWRREKSFNYYMRYQLTGNYLVVVGDVGDAIYQWSQKLTWDFLAGCELDYFVSKCVASEEGRPYVMWSPEVARGWFEGWKKEYPDAAKKLRDDPPFGSQYEFAEFLSDNDFIFGSDWGEDANVGTVMHMRAIGHWVGLQMMLWEENRLTAYD